jgi:kynureninase
MGQTDLSQGISGPTKPYKKMIKGFFKNNIDFARHVDQEDPLRGYRKEFYLPDENTIYLDGNSLGRLPQGTRYRMKEVIDHQWGTRLIRSWNEGWYDRTLDISEKLERIIGARAGEVISCDSTSVNLYKLAYASLKAKPARTKIVSDELNFPTDLYILQGIIGQLGPEYALEIVKSEDGQCISMKALDRAIDNNTALVVLSHVAFKSAFMYDMKAVTELVQSKGALMLWDLSHAAGAVTLKVGEHNADMAIGCTYKYLNGGPGSPAYLYVKTSLQEKLSPPLWGWFGEHDPFAFSLKYKPAKGIKKFLVGTPPVLSLEAINPGLDIILAAGLNRIREKSVLLTEFLLFLYDELLADHGFLLGSPRDAEIRGSHISLRHPEAYRICQALINPTDDVIKVIPDFREPDNIRLGFAPLYNTFEEVFRSVHRIKNIVEGMSFQNYSNEREAVT